jgi:hypothetical protein
VYWHHHFMSLFVLQMNQMVTVGTKAVPVSANLERSEARWICSTNCYALCQTYRAQRGDPFGNPGGEAARWPSEDAATQLVGVVRSGVGVVTIGHGTQTCLLIACDCAGRSSNSLLCSHMPVRLVSLDTRCSRVLDMRAVLSSGRRAFFIPHLLSSAFLSRLLPRICTVRGQSCDWS